MPVGSTIIPKAGLTPTISHPRTKAPRCFGAFVFFSVQLLCPWRCRDMGYSDFSTTMDFVHSVRVSIREQLPGAKDIKVSFIDDLSEGNPNHIQIQISLVYQDKPYEITGDLPSRMASKLVESVRKDFPESPVLRPPWNTSCGRVPMATSSKRA